MINFQQGKYIYFKSLHFDAHLPLAMIIFTPTIIFQSNFEATKTLFLKHQSDQTIKLQQNGATSTQY